MPASSSPESYATGSTDGGSQGPLRRLQGWLNRRKTPSGPASTLEQENTAADSEYGNDDAKSRFSNLSGDTRESGRTSSGTYIEEGYVEERLKYPMIGQAAGYDDPSIYNKHRYHRRTVDAGDTVDNVIEQGRDNWPEDRDVQGPAAGAQDRNDLHNQTFNNHSVSVPGTRRYIVPPKGPYRVGNMTFNNP